MRLRPIGPGIGGLYYSPLLADAKAMEKTTQAIARLPRYETARARPQWLHTLWQTVVLESRRFGARFVQARLAQAEAQVAQTKATLNPARSRSRDDLGTRYY